MGLALISSLLSAQPNWDWGFGQQGFMNDIVTDSNGYSYVVGQVWPAGFAGFPLVDGGGFLAKVSPNGNVLWCRAFTNAQFDELELRNNLLYATGKGHWNIAIGSHTFTVDSTIHAYLVAQFDTSGTENWVNISYYTGDIATGDIDANDAGELFIAASGYLQIYTDVDTLDFGWWNRQVLVWKYAPDGTLQWIRSAGCPGSKSRGLGIACDESGSAYLTGFASTDSTYCEEVLFGSLVVPVPSSFFLTKVDGAGNFVWVKHGFGAIGRDVEYLGGDSIAVIGHFYDSTNAVGSTVLESERFDMFMGSFDLEGDAGWSYQSHVTNDSSYCEGIRLQRSDDGSLIALTHGLYSIVFDGTLVNSVGDGFQVSKFSPTGLRYWTATMETYPGSPGNYIEPHGLSSDGDGRAYVSGQFICQTGMDPYLAWSTDSIQGALSNYTLFVARTDDNVLTTSSIALDRPTIYPNPTNGLLTTSDPSQGISIAVLDLSGRAVLPEQRVSRYLDISALADGVYLIRTHYGQEVWLSRIILQR